MVKKSTKYIKKVEPKNIGKSNETSSIKLKLCKNLCYLYKENTVIIFRRFKHSDIDSCDYRRRRLLVC
jgi:hypothetical protein